MMNWIKANFKARKFNFSIRKKQRFTDIFADIFALNTFCYFISIPIELGFAQMSLETHWHARFVGFFVITATARPLGIWRDWVFNKLKLTSNSQGVFPYLVDTFVYLSFEMPLYGINLVISDATFDEIIKSIFTFSLISGVIGRPYGIYRTYIRENIFQLTCTKRRIKE